MSSNINPNNIDGNYPIAGQDNSSQGFRDNFTNIRNNFIFTEQEITDLQSKVLLKSALSNQTIDNDMAGAQIKRPQLTAWTQSLLDLTTRNTGETATLDFNLANFQKFATGGSAGTIDLRLINWPQSTGTNAQGYGVMRVWIHVTNKEHKIVLPTSVSVNDNDIAGYNSVTRSIKFDKTGDYVFDFSSIDGGATYLIFDVTRNRATFRDPSFYFNSTVSPSLFIGFNENSLPIAQDIEGTYDDVLNCHEGINAISAGNLSIATPNNPMMEDTELPGYHMYAARGNLDIGNVQPVSGGDLTGYLTSRAFTGNASGNAWANMSSISFSASGSNLINGVGGNIGFWTAPDGSTATERMLQAASINSDQSTKFFGNVEIVGNLKINSGLIKNGTYYQQLATTGGSFAANAAVTTVIIDSTGSNTIAWANISLPRSPKDKQTFTISAVAPILNANINQPEYPTSNANVKFIATNAFSTGNVVINLTYMDGTKTWYRS